MIKSMQNYKHFRPSAIRIKDSVRFSLLAVTCSFLTLATAAAGGEKSSDATACLDEINLGDKASEQAHEMEYKHSEQVTGEFNQKARRLLPKPKPERFGGEMTFKLKVDPEKTNYVTFKFFGNGRVNTAFYLFHDGDRIPPFKRRSLLPVGSGSPGPPFPSRFFYVTRKIPEFRTAGKEYIELTVKSAGPDWGYHGNLPKQSGASRPVYRVYSHTDAFFQPAPDEPQGEPVEVKAFGMPEQYADSDLREKLIKGADAKVKAELEKPGEKADTRTLLRIYDKEWSEFYQDDKVLTHVAPAIIENVDKDIRKMNKRDNWPSLGGGAHIPFGGEARQITYVYPGAEKLGLLGEKVDLDDNPDTEPMPRRLAYAQFFAKVLQHYGFVRDSYTANCAYGPAQSTVWLYKAVQTLEPEMMPESNANSELSEDALFDYLYTIQGLGGGEATAKGLLRERRGYDSGYGWPRVRRDRWPGYVLEDEIFRRRMKHMVRAINHFVVPRLDGKRWGFRTESIVAFRQARYPGRETGPQFKYAALLEEPSAIRRAQLYLARDRIYQDGLPTGPNEVDNILKVMDMPPTNYRLPMEAEHQDFVFTDEGNGVIAMKHGDRQIYGSFVLREAIDSRKPQQRALFHYTTPSIDRIAYIENVQRYKINKNGQKQLIELVGESNRKPGYKIIKNDQQQKVEISGGKDWPDGVSRRAAFNRVRYGDYLFGMNTTQTETFELEAPAALAEDLVSGRMYRGGADGKVKVDVPPRTTTVLYLGAK